MKETDPTHWYEYVPGHIILREVKNSDKSYHVDADIFLLFLIEKGLIGYPDVFPKRSQKVKDIFKPKKVNGNSNWTAWGDNTDKMLSLLLEYFKITS